MKRRVSLRRRLVFVVIATTTAFSLLASAQQKPTAPAKAAAKPAAPAAPAKPTGKPPAAPLKPDPDSDTASAHGSDRDAGASTTPKEEKAPPTSKDPKDKGGAAVESKTLDGGERVFRFGEVEVEGRLKSPQIVYFLRRVRAEFAAGDLGHRTFMRELSETKNEPGF